MCTLSLVPAQGERGWRVMMNRDERRTHPAAWPPMTEEVGGTAIVRPVDSQALGTWIAATEHGLAYAVMNACQAESLLPRTTAISRGTIIPAVGACDEPADAIGLVRALPLSSMAPFRLVVTSGLEIASARWDGRDLRCAIAPFMRPLLFASSSLGDRQVQRPREELFEHLLRQERDPWRAQDRLHVHAWPDRRHLSVNMSRIGACTVSCTTVVVTETSVELRYVPYLDGWPGPATTRALPRALRAFAGAA